MHKGSQKVLNRDFSEVAGGRLDMGRKKSSENENFFFRLNEKNNSVQK